MGEGWSRGKLVKVTRVLVGVGDHVSTVAFLVPCRGVRGPGAGGPGAAGLQVVSLWLP